MPGEHGGRGVCDLYETVLAHFEHADLVGRAEAVFGGTQTAERTGRFALEIQHAVYHMLEDLRSGERALLVHMTDDENGHVFVFRILHQTHRAFLDLRRAAGRGGQIALVDRLDRVHDENVGRHELGLVDDLIHVGLREDIQLGGGDVQTGRAELDLPERLLAGNIQHAGVPAHLLTHLEQKRGFADAGLTANEHERAVHRAAAENAVKLPDAGKKTRLVAGLDVAEQGRPRCAAHEARRAARGGRGGRLEFAHGVPCAAGRAFSVPFRRLIAAVAA